MHYEEAGIVASFLRKNSPTHFLNYGLQALQEGMVADKWVEEKDSADLEHDVLFK